jgi:GTP cyclohydrolase I
VHDANYFSICAHHFLPFFGKVSISYVPGDRILGLGKFPRLVQAYSRRFQIQEYLVRDIAEEIMSSGGAQAVRVTSTGRHLCMCSRGPSDQTVITDTSYVAGHQELLGKYGLAE